MTPILSVRNLSLQLNGQAILAEISFDVFRGEYVGLVGPNGAGKTSLMRCLTGIYSNCKGDITVSGLAIKHVHQKELARHLAYLPQVEGGSFPYQVEEFVLMSRYPHVNPFLPPGRQDREASERAMQMTGVWEFRHRLVDQLSGGERQRVLLAAALAQSAEILLLDEATTFLDYRYQQEVRALLRQINREQGVTILAVTHDLNMAAVSSDRILGLFQGRLVFSGTPSEFMDRAVIERVFGFTPQLVPHPAIGLPMIVPAPLGGAP